MARRSNRPASKAFLAALANQRSQKVGIPRSRKPRRAGNETPRVTAILEALALKGYWAWRVNSSLTVFEADEKHERRVIKGAPKGSPDIMVIIGRGRLCGIECKTEVGKQSANQKEWEATAKKHGVGYGLARSIGDAFTLVAGWERGML